MQYCGAPKRPLRKIIKAVAYAHPTPHGRLSHTNAIIAAVSPQHATTPPGYRRWPRDGGRVATGQTRAATRYSTAAPETQEHRTATQNETSDADISQGQGLRITRTTLFPKDGEGPVRRLVLGEEHDYDLEVKSHVSVQDTSRGHGPVRRVLSGKDAEDVDAYDHTHPHGAQSEMQPASGSSHEASPQLEPKSSSYFHDMIEAVSASRLRDGTDYTKYRPRFGRRYFECQQRGFMARKEKHDRMIQLKVERRASFAHDDWQVILKLLDAHTPAGPELYKRKVDTLTLPEGFVAVFHRDISLAILELRQRTGSHLQLVDGSSRRIWVDGTQKVAFAVLTLSGSANENEAALNILPEYVYVYSAKELNASRDLNDYDLQRRQRSVVERDDYEALRERRDRNSIESDTTRPESDNELSSADLSMLHAAIKSITSPVRSVWSVGRWRPDHPRYQLGVPPAVRSMSSMTWYIFDITMPTPTLTTRNEARTGDPHAKAHVDRVIEELVSLCTDATAPSWLSAEALDKALYYLLRHNNLRASRTIRRALETGGKYQFSASNYSVLLDGAARTGDVHNFLMLTRLMLKREVPMTPQVWQHFCQLVSVRQIPDAFGAVCEVMRAKGLLVNRKLAEVVSLNLVLERLHADLKAEIPFEDLWVNCDARVASICPRGFDWFNMNTANRMIQVMLQWGQLETAYRVVERLRKRDAPIPTSTLNLFLASAQHNGDPAAVASMLQRFQIGQVGAIVPDMITYANLFNIAWLRRYHNMLRVIWRYACAAGHVNYSMRSRLRGSLCSATAPGDIDSKVMSRGKLWTMFAGKFAVGVSRGLTKGRRQEDADMRGTLPKSEQHLLQLVSQKMAFEGSEEDGDRNAALLEFMQNDLNEVNNCMPSEPLSKMLAEAYAIDTAWREGPHLGLPKGLSTHCGPNDMFAEMLRQGIKVRMQAGDFTRMARKSEAPGALALLEQRR